MEGNSHRAFCVYVVLMYVIRVFFCFFNQSSFPFSFAFVIAIVRVLEASSSVVVLWSPTEYI